jgi:hypothetical protein
MDRFFERHAHSVLLYGGSLALFLLVAAALISSGLVSLEAHAQPAWLKYILRVASFIRENLQTFEQWAKLIGALAGLATAVASISRGVKYARRQLPKRFRELFREDEARLTANRELVRAVINGVRTSFLHTKPTLTGRQLDLAFQRLGKGDRSGALDTLANADKELKGLEELAKDHMANLRHHQATGHVVAGAIHLSLVRSGAMNSVDHSGLALAAFSKALGFVPHDVDALEFRAETYWLRSSPFDSNQDFEAMRAAAILQFGENEIRMRTAAARAARRLAQNEHERGIATGVQLAHTNAYNWLQLSPSHITDQREPLAAHQRCELARIMCLAARISSSQYLAAPQNFANRRRDGLNHIHGLTGDEADGLRAELNALQF